jgi:protoporphyrinogen oxidase
MEPYNRKVWAYPLNEMSKDWIEERVSVVDIQRVLKNIIFQLDDVNWGPNNKFIFPLQGGTGEIFRRFVPYIKEHLHLNKEVLSIDLKNKNILFSDGEKELYDHLINTMPLDIFINKIDRIPESITEQTSYLKHTNGIIVGLGFKKKIDNNRCWMYFPENHNPFYRVTNFSNYSFNNVPHGDTEQYYSLMSEVSYSDHKEVDKDNIIEETIQGLINTGMISKDDKKKIVSRYLLDAECTYPVPTLQRDKALNSIQKYLESKGVFSRGRFGGWKYEVGNMDHSTMQGVEVVDRLLLDKIEKTYVLK